jgi:hypothetical protein
VELHGSIFDTRQPARHAITDTVASRATRGIGGIEIGAASTTPLQQDRGARGEGHPAPSCD